MNRLRILLFCLPLLGGCTSSFLFFFGNSASQKKVNIQAYSSLHCAVQAEVRKDWEKADLWIRRALKKDSSSAELLRHAGVIQFKKGNLQEGLAFLKKASALTLKDPFFHLDMAATYEGQGYFSQALDEYLKALKMKPGLTWPVKRLLQILDFLQKPSLAKFILEELTHQPLSVGQRQKVSLRLAQALRLLKEPQKAYEILKTLKSVASLEKKVLLESIYLATSQKNYSRGIQSCYLALQKYPKDISFYYALGVILEKDGQKTKARIVFNELLQLLISSLPKPSSLSLSQRYTLMGELYLKVQRNRQALRSLLKAIEINPFNRQATVMTSNILYKNNSIQLAGRILEAYLQKVPYDKELKGELAYLYSKRGWQLPRAIQYATESLEVFPNNSKFLYALGWSYFQRFQFNKALSTLLQANLAKNSSEISQALGHTFFCMGDLEKSREWYLKAQQLSPKNREVKKKLRWIEELTQEEE